MKSSHNIKKHVSYEEAEPPNHQDVARAEGGRYHRAIAVGHGQAAAKYSYAQHAMNIAKSKLLKRAAYALEGNLIGYSPWLCVRQLTDQHVLANHKARVRQILLSHLEQALKLDKPEFLFQYGTIKRFRDLLGVYKTGLPPELTERFVRLAWALILAERQRGFKSLHNLTQAMAWLAHQISCGAIPKSAARNQAGIEFLQKLIDHQDSENDLEWHRVHKLAQELLEDLK